MMHDYFISHKIFLMDLSNSAGNDNFEWNHVYKIVQQDAYFGSKFYQRL